MSCGWYWTKRAYNKSLFHVNIDLNKCSISTFICDVLIRLTNIFVSWKTIFRKSEYHHYIFHARGAKTSAKYSNTYMKLWQGGHKVSWLLFTTLITAFRRYQNLSLDRWQLLIRKITILILKISASCAGCVQGRETRPPDDNSLMLIDFDRVWMRLIDAGWFWLTIDDNLRSVSHKLYKLVTRVM